MVVYDDGADPARHNAARREAVERRQAKAFLANSEVFTSGDTSYIEQKRIPVIGTIGGEEWVYSSPMYFTHHASGEALFYTFLAAAADQTLSAGPRKLGTLVCVEVAACTNAGNTYARAAPELGFHLAYRGQASIAQPDFTAECLSARNAGVEVFFLNMDANSTARIASSCARQGFHPLYASGASLVADHWKDDPNLDGLVASSDVFPYFQTGTPGADEFQDSVKRLGKGLNLGVGVASGWTAGKLLERAAVNLPEPPTSEALLHGLWAMKAVDLGGLTYPLTFTQNQPPPRQRCWFNIALKESTWVSPDGYRLRCR